MDLSRDVGSIHYLSVFALSSNKLRYQYEYPVLFSMRTGVYERSILECNYEHGTCTQMYFRHPSKRWITGQENRFSYNFLLFDPRSMLWTPDISGDFVVNSNLIKVY